MARCLVNFIKCQIAGSLHLPPVVINAIFIGSMIGFISSSIQQIPIFIVYVGLGQLIVCYLLGLPFLIFLEKYKDILFKENT